MSALVSVLVVSVLCVTTVVLAEQMRRYYTRRNEFEYKIQRLEHDNIMLADGGEDDEVDQ